MSEIRQSISSAIEQFYEQLKADYPDLAEIEPDTDLLESFEHAARDLARDWIERGEHPQTAQPPSLKEARAALAVKIASVIQDASLGQRMAGIINASFIRLGPLEHNQLLRNWNALVEALRDTRARLTEEMP